MKRHEAIGCCNQCFSVRQAIAHPTMSFRILLPYFIFYIPVDTRSPILVIFAQSVWLYLSFVHNMPISYILLLQYNGYFSASLSPFSLR